MGMFYKLISVFFLYLKFETTILLPPPLPLFPRTATSVTNQISKPPPPSSFQRRSTLSSSQPLRLPLPTMEPWPGIPSPSPRTPIDGSPRDSSNDIQDSEFSAFSTNSNVDTGAMEGINKFLVN